MAELLPPRDLLQKVEGVEAGLRRNRRVGLAGWLGILLSVLEVMPAVSGRMTRVDFALAVAFPFTVATSLFLIGRSRFWRMESREPFRYTCSVTAFKPLEDLARTDFLKLQDWMRYDLSERLNERIGRLSFLDDLAGPPERPPRGIDEDAWSSHIHVSGEYLVRTRGDRGDQRVIEVTPRIRIGGPHAAATLAHPAKFEVTRPQPGAPDAAVLDTRSADEQKASPTPPSPGLRQSDYDKLLERVYFSVATQIYRQIRKDVQRKIGLLPTRFLRATAYFHEAEDYVSSNTLDAYDEANKLYDAAMKLYDARLRPLPAKPANRPYLRFLQRKTNHTWRWRRRLANYWPRLCTPEVMTARAEIGYAGALLYRRILAGMSGHRLNPVFEARPVVLRAIERLRPLPEHVPGRQEAMFHGHVTLALAWYLLEATRPARDCLREARCVLPARFGSDPRYLYAAGLIEPRLRCSVPVLRNAVEKDPRFEIAQFQLALRTELVWRRRPSLESTVARMVVEEYEEVLKLNPGNIRAWGNIGYVCWLLGNDDASSYAYARGREYKQIQRGTDVGALDYGLARLAAERGDVDQAYTHYLSAVSSHVTQGVSDSRITSSQYYFFDFIGDAMLRRFEAYSDAVLSMCKGAGKEAQSVPPRVRQAVAAFVLNDLGEALHTYYIRNADRDAGRRAREAYEEAMRQNPTFVLPHYNLYLMAMYESDIDAALEQLEQVRDIEPTWTDAILACLAAHAEWANDRTWRQPVKLVSSDGASSPSARVASRRRGAEREGGKGLGKTIQLPPAVKERAEAIAKDRDLREELERLLPHSWWWDRADGGDLAFRWPAVADLNFERTREMDDLHVRSLLMWDIAHLLLELERLPLSHHRPSGVESQADAHMGSMARLLVGKIKEHFWPANFRVLLTWRQMCPDEAADADLRELVDHWLGSDPTSHWALQIVRSDFYDFYGQSLPLFRPEQQKTYLRKARDECQLRLRQGGEGGRAMSTMLAWVDGELEDLSVKVEEAQSTRTLTSASDA